MRSYSLALMLSAGDAEGSTKTDEVGDAVACRGPCPAPAATLQPAAARPRIAVVTGLILVVRESRQQEPLSGVAEKESRADGRDMPIPAVETNGELEEEEEKQNRPGSDGWEPGGYRLSSIPPARSTGEALQWAIYSTHRPRARSGYKFPVRVLQDVVWQFFYNRTLCNAEPDKDIAGLSVRTGT